MLLSEELDESDEPEDPEDPEDPPHPARDNASVAASIVAITFLFIFLSSHLVVLFYKPFA